MCCLLACNKWICASGIRHFIQTHTVFKSQVFPAISLGGKTDFRYRRRGWACLWYYYTTLKESWNWDRGILSSYCVSQAVRYLASSEQEEIKSSEASWNLKKLTKSFSWWKDSHDQELKEAEKYEESGDGFISQDSVSLKTSP